MAYFHYSPQKNINNALFMKKTPKIIYKASCLMAAGGFA
jgi:hypothetical protein